MKQHGHMPILNDLEENAPAFSNSTSLQDGSSLPRIPPNCTGKQCALPQRGVHHRTTNVLSTSCVLVNPEQDYIEDIAVKKNTYFLRRWVEIWKITNSSRISRCDIFFRIEKVVFACNGLLPLVRTIQFGTPTLHTRTTQQHRRAHHLTFSGRVLSKAVFSTNRGRSFRGRHKKTPKKKYTVAKRKERQKQGESIA